jgi:hypothetical protein
MKRDGEKYVFFMEHCYPSKSYENLKIENNETSAARTTVRVCLSIRKMSSRFFCHLTFFISAKKKHQKKHENRVARMLVSQWVFQNFLSIWFGWNVLSKKKSKVKSFQTLHPFFGFGTPLENTKFGN